MKIFKLLIISILLLSSNLIANKIAVATKVNGDVEIMPVDTKNFSKLKPGTVLSDGDKIRTGNSGFAVIIFIDDKSILKLKGNSEATIAGQRTSASISKKINMDSGTVRATITKQNVNFVIQTPTSVASVKGTDFWLLSDPISGDEVIGLDGIVNLTNNETGEEVDVTEGNSGISNPDGSVGLEETDPNSIPDDPSDDQEGPSQIRIYLDGPNGEQKVIVIDYQ
ncbi:MAG: FecR domain-containing protein [Candidatus Neomarinimicrobiota bacterium]|nr:hypothetical protein [Candidatus Neomarinimicrobiota bacterium]